jgi:hypothetical protein
LLFIGQWDDIADIDGLLSFLLTETRKLFMLQSPRTITRRFVAVMTVLATLIAAGFTSPSAALALFVLPVSGPVCGFTQT